MLQGFLKSIRSALKQSMLLPPARRRIHSRFALETLQLEQRTLLTTALLTAPDSGTFEVDQTITITGTASDSSGISHIWIELYKGGTAAANRVGYIYQGSNGSGNISSRSWKIPTTLPSGHTLNGTDYKIKWVAFPKSTVTAAAGDFSNSNLTIRPAQNPTISNLTAAPTPLNQGASLTIGWIAADNVGVTNIGAYLYQGGSGPLRRECR